MSTTPRAAGQPRPDFLARFLSAVPLLAIYFGLAALYAWQASRRPVPTIFTDELELTQLARSIAETGEPARRGEPYGVASLVAYALAPVWWLGSTTASWAAAKLILVLAMTSAVFPAYGLARMVVPKPYALAAAGGAIAVPALAYAPILVEEPFAYPLATLALWLIARALERTTWGRAAAAVGVSVVALLTRQQLAVLLVVLVLGLLWLAWQSEPGRRWRSQWSRWDWAGAVVLCVGVAVGFSALLGHLSESWVITTSTYKERIVQHMAWAAGALAIGIGVLPVLAGVASLARPSGERRRDPATRAFVITSVTAIAVFLAYAGVKGAYISTNFGTYVVERNLIYLCPILFIATALAFHRGVGRGWAIAGAAVFTFAVVAVTPLNLAQYPYYEARGLSMAAFANRELGWAEGAIEAFFIGLCVVAVVVVVVLKRLRPSSTAFAAVAGVAAVAVVAWSMTGQVYAAEAERTFSRQFDRNLPKPYEWVEDATGGESVVVIGQAINDPTNIWLTEFFNPSVRKMWSLDGSAKEVGGPILTPDLDAVDGTLTPSPETEYALAVNGVRLQAPIVAERENAVLYRIDGGPLVLQDTVVGRDTDGWMTGNSEDPIARASYTRYDVSEDEPGLAVIELTRIGWCPSEGKRQVGKATVRIGPVGIGPDNQPRIEQVTETKTFDVPDCNGAGETFQAPNVPWRMEITVAPTFVPKEVDPTRSDTRQLGAVIVRADFEPLFD